MSIIKTLLRLSIDLGWFNMDILNQSAQSLVELTEMYTNLLYHRDEIKKGLILSKNSRDTKTYKAYSQSLRDVESHLVKTKDYINTLLLVIEKETKQEGDHV